MTLWIYVLVAAIAAAGSWKVQDWRYGSIENTRHQVEARDALRHVEHVDVAATDLEQDKERIRTQFITITKEVDHVVQSNFYAAGQPACLDDAGLRELTAAVRPAAAASEPAPAVPGSAGAGGRNPG